MFAELAARSAFSFLEGASQPEELVDQSALLGLEALGLCDRNGLYGVVRAWVRCQHLTKSDQRAPRLLVGAQLDIELGLQNPTSRSRVILLCEDAKGYECLCRLLTRAHEGQPKGQALLPIEALSQWTQGLWALLPLSEKSEEPRADEASSAVIKELFGDRTRLLATRQLDSQDGWRTQRTQRLANRFGLPVVASARPLMHVRTRKPLADVLACIRQGITLDEAGRRLLPNSEARLRSERQMLALFSDQPQWVHAAGEVALSLRFDLAELHYHFPCSLPQGQTADERLRELTWQGASRRYPQGVPESVRAQINRELLLIARLGKAPYFISIWEIVEVARQRRILCQGRGSAANSAVCFALGITAVDPARSKLLFERFMSEERDEPPDIDIDFEHSRREEVIQAIYERHGRHRAAMVSEVICFRGRSSLREVGRVFGLSEEQLSRLVATISAWDPVEKSVERLAEQGFDPQEPRLRQLLQLAMQLQGFPRHLSIHVGGFVLSSRDLAEVAPVEPARMPGRTVIAWDKDDIEALGFFKVDVLALGMLTAIRRSMAMLHGCGILRLHPEEAFDPIECLARIPSEDPAVYEMTRRADTVGVFQIESRAQMAMLPRLAPRCFYDLVVQVAIVRPGPIHGGMVHPYLRRRTGEEAVRVPHPELWPILERTMGIPLFQEQVMQIAIVGAGYSGGEADRLRRDMASWRKNGRLLAHRERLLQGLASKGVSAQFGEALFEQIKGFGEYGFPESHAASFALLVYASAWLKVHHPAHFLCGLLNSQPMGFYSPSSLVRDAGRHGVTVFDVDVCSSEWDCTLESTHVDEGAMGDSGAEGVAGMRQMAAVRLGLRQIKGLSESVARRIVEARLQQPLKTVADLGRRAALPQRQLELLARSGALVKLTKERRQALWQVSAPKGLGLYAATTREEPVAQLPALSPMQQLVFDYGSKGLSLTDHPLSHLREELETRGVLLANQFPRAAQGTRVSVAGLVLSRQQPHTAHGVIFLTLEDETGVVNLIVRTHLIAAFRWEVRQAPMLLATGRVEKREIPEYPAHPVVHLLVDRLHALNLSGAHLPRMSRDFH
jgi:error-prone DNA polymerase